MTARKNFKRLVRARARKTGESYAAALSHFDEEVPAAQRNATTTLHDLRRVEKPEYGFALRVPDDWKELPPDLRNSAWEVARFSANDPAIRARHRNCLVFRNPAPTGVDAHTAARNAQPVLEVGGFGNFTHLDAADQGHASILIAGPAAVSGRYVTTTLSSKTSRSASALALPHQSTTPRSWTHLPLASS